MSQLRPGRRLRPAAFGWRQLVASVHARTPPLPIPVETPEQYDAIVLHHIVGCELEEIAATTGQEFSKIRYLLRSWKHSATQASVGGTTGPACCTAVSFGLPR